MAETIQKFFGIQSPARSTISDTSRDNVHVKRSRIQYHRRCTDGRRQICCHSRYHRR